MAKVIGWLAFVGLIALVVGSVWLVRHVDDAWRWLSSRGEATPVPSPTPLLYPSAVTVIEGIQSLSRLETASYHIEKVITAESGQGPLGFLFGDRLLLVAYGQVIAGVDLSLIGPESVRVMSDGTVYLRLPPVEVFVATLDNSRTYVYDRRTGVAGMNAQLETAARREAEKLILQAALEEGLLETAEANARAVLRSFVLGMGFRHVVFVDKLPAPESSPTPTAVATIYIPP